MWEIVTWYYTSVQVSHDSKNVLINLKNIVNAYHLEKPASIVLLCF